MSASICRSTPPHHCHRRLSAAAGAHLPPIVPGAQEQLGPELTEVVEQTGSPSMSARRRRQTVFSSDSSSSSPQLSPTKRRSSRFVGGL